MYNHLGKFDHDLMSFSRSLEWWELDWGNLLEIILGRSFRVSEILLFYPNRWDIYHGESGYLT